VCIIFFLSAGKEFRPFEWLCPGGEKEYFLIVSRLSPYKKVEVAVEAMNKLNLTLIVIGEGEPK